MASLKSSILFALVMLTQLDGNIIWVEAAHVSIIKTGCRDYKPGAVVSVGGRELCVRESVDQIREKLKRSEH
jgi:uncharacterized protein YlzI (FlbEa/FlbD family)